MKCSEKGVAGKARDIIERVGVRDCEVTVGGYILNVFILASQKNTDIFVFFF